MYRLTCGKTTEDVDLYIKDWMSVAEPLSEILEMSIYGFNPMITLNTGCSSHPTVSFDPQKAKSIIEKFNKK